MITYFSVSLSVLIIVLGSVILIYSEINFTNQSYEYCRQIVESDITLFDIYLRQLKTMAIVIAGDAEIHDAVTYRCDGDEQNYIDDFHYQRKAADKLRQITALGNVKSAYIIGAREPYEYYYGPSPKSDVDFGALSWFTDAVSLGYDRVVFTNDHPSDYFLTESGNDVVSIITPIYDKPSFFSVKIAYLVCDFDLSSIIPKASHQGDISIAIYDDKTPVYFSGQDLLTAEQQNRLSDNLSENRSSFVLEKTRGAAQSYLVVNRKSEVSEWSISGLRPLSGVDRIRTALSSFMSAALIVSVLIVVLLSVLISRSLLVPMNKLIASFDGLAAGETDVRFEKTNSEEINTLSNTAENMLRRINELTEDLITKQKQFSNEQLKVLQNQINPHFLNNTLQSVKSFAVIGDMDSVSKMMTLLGKLLAYSVYEPFEMVRLRDELLYTENYLLLEKIRYPLITYHIDVDEKVQDVFVPKLILQPLAENSIEHGFSDSKEGSVSICADIDESELHIVVTDSGSGIGEEKQKEIALALGEGNPCGASSSIGLLNVHQRIQSIFGGEYGVSVLSREGMSTSVVITIPRETQGGGTEAGGEADED